MGAEGVVVGILKPDGTLNMEQMKELMDAAGDMSVTLHRAFDVCADPIEAMEQAISLGINTILTSGQKNTCLQGAELLKELETRSRGRITIQAGSGVGAEVIRQLYPHLYNRNLQTADGSAHGSGYPNASLFPQKAMGRELSPR